MSLKHGIKFLSLTFRRYRLKIDITKIFFYFFDQQYEYPLSISSLGDKQLENVKTYTYSGSVIRFEHTAGETEINLHLDAAECKFYPQAKYMLNMKINIKIQVLMLNSLIRSRIIYAC